jgi:16S rRNA (guanine527-N7)-methyltransferase
MIDAGSGAAQRWYASRRRRALSRVREPLPTHVRDLPALPASYHETLDAGLRALGVELDPVARTAIDDHVRLLLAWTSAINLTAIRDPAAVATAHVLDSLSALPLLRALEIDAFLDLGSGGGYPGLPLAAARPGVRCTLVDATAKKARFLSVAVEAIGLAERVSVVTARVEDLARDPAHRGRWRLVTARAVASLADLVELAFPLLASRGTLVAWKRGDLTAELRAASRAIDALGGGSLAVHDVAVEGSTGHRLVVATRTGRVPATFPRDPGIRRRRPW